MVRAISPQPRCPPRRATSRPPPPPPQLSPEGLPSTRTRLLSTTRRAGWGLVRRRRVRSLRSPATHCSTATSLRLPRALLRRSRFPTPPRQRQRFSLTIRTPSPLPPPPR